MDTTVNKVIILITTLLIIPVTTYASPHCGELGNTYGPFDYTNAEHRANKLKVVEIYHFTKEVENLTSAVSGRWVGGELDYTLRAFPNHHRALLALNKLAIRDRTHKPKGTKYSVLCYFDRAIRFKPDDATVYTIFSNYLLKTGKNKLALQNLEIAEKIDPENPAIKYNLGLLYFNKKNYDKAMSYAKDAYALGFPLPGLKNKLKNVGKWAP